MYQLYTGKRTFHNQVAQPTVGTCARKMNMEQCTVYSTTGTNSICLHKNITTDVLTNQAVVFISIVWFGCCCYCYWWWYQPVAGIGRGSTTTDAAHTISSIPNNTQSFHATDTSTSRKYWNRLTKSNEFFRLFYGIFRHCFLFYAIVFVLAAFQVLNSVFLDPI